MESEQFMKLTEDIRKQLSRGNYQMDMGDLPYSAQARNVAVVLWEAGWRPAEAESSLYRDLYDRETHRWATLKGLERELLDEIEHPSELFWTEAEREAYVGGLNVGVQFVAARRLESAAAMRHWEDRETEALKAEGYSDEPV